MCGSLLTLRCTLPEKSRRHAGREGVCFAPRVPRGVSVRLRALKLFGLAATAAARPHHRDDDEQHQADEGDDERGLEEEHDEADERDELFDERDQDLGPLKIKK